MATLRIVGYIAFFLFAFMFGLYWTFPYSVAKDRLLGLASKEAKMQIAAKSMSPSWFTGVVLKDITVKESAEDPDPLKVPELRVRAHVLPLLTGGRGITVDLPIAQGDVHADVVRSSAGIDVVAQADALELALIPELKDATGIPLAGKLDLDIDLFMGTDPKASEGLIKIKGSGLETLEGGKVNNFPVPALAIGSFDWTIPVNEGKAALDQLTLTGENIELKIDGQINLGSPPDRSTLNLTVSFKPTPAFLKKEPLLGPLLNNLKRTKDQEGFYNYAVTGTVKRPRFFPKRR